MAWLSYSSLIPPNLFILLAMIGVLIAWRRKPLGLAVATAAIGLLYLAAMPVTAGLLIRWAEAIAFDEPTLPSDTPPGAIIVLSADARRSEHPRRARHCRAADPRAPRRGGETAAASRPADPGQRRRTAAAPPSPR